MPIRSPIVTKRITQDEFQPIASEVMHHVFAIHNEFGRFFEEQIYKKELASRMSGVALESSITLTHTTFLKTYYVDLLVNNCGLFEFKAVDTLHPRHRGQTLNYLLLLDLGHGKVINIRAEQVGHQFVNCPRRLVDLRNPMVHDRRWNAHLAGAEAFRDQLMAIISDWGAGLDVGLYEEAMTHFLGGETRVIVPVPVLGTLGHVADQRMRMAAPHVAFKITGLLEREEDFENHVRKLIDHTSLTAVLWVNITQENVTFTTLS